MEFNKMLLLIILMVTAVIAQNTGIEENVEILTRNFFSNLQEDPQLKGENFTESSKTFIDKLVGNYLDLMKYTLGVSKHMVTRRSLPIDGMNILTKDSTGIHMLSGFKELLNIGARYPRDIVMFYHDYDGYKQWYAIILEGEKQKMANTMVIYKLLKSQFEKIKELVVQNGTRLAVHLTEQTVFIAVAEYNPLKQNLYEETGIFEFTRHEELRKIQTLNIQYANDIKMWQDDHNLFLFVAQHMVNTSNKITYEVNMPIYKWLGKHFDITQEIKTYGAKRIESFTVGKSHFLVVANYQNDYGKTNIYSEIFKYDLNTDKFKSHQKILTNAAVDVKHFYFAANNIEEHFLVFANLFETDTEGSLNYETDSIIYKYIEGYFMPFQSFKLNGATEWLPIMGQDNAVVLLVACKFEGVKAFQYNGWKFLETSEYTTGVFSKGVAAMHSYRFNDNIILVIANENDHEYMSNIFEVGFVHKNELSQFQENMLNWCKHNIKTLQDMEIKPILKKEDKTIEDPILQLEQNHTAGITAENLEILEIEELDKEPQDFNEIKSIILKQSKQLDTIEKQMESSLLADGTNIIEGNININKLILNNNISYFNTLNATFINSVNISDVVNNVININEGFAIKNTIQIKDVTIKNQFSPKFINKEPATSLIHRNLDNRLGHLVVNGTVTINKELNIKGKVNGINFNKKHILLHKGDQLLMNLQANSLQIENLEKNENSANLTFLSVKKVFVKGYVNDIDIATLDKFALRKHGSQNITSEYSFDTLHTDSLYTKKLSGKLIPDDLILTKNGDFEIKDSVEFTTDFLANNIIITERLNGIPAENGTLNVLLSDVPHVQHIKGLKKFENLQLQNPINLQGKINSSRLDKMNPVSIVDEEVVLNGDYIISGNVTVEQFVKANDIQTDSQTLGIQKLWNKGLKLVEQQIPVNLQFQQQLHVDELFADKINDINVNSFIVMGLEEPQIISGWKKFIGDVHILGSTKVTNMNGINLQEFESNILKTTGNQTLLGKHHFQTVIANRVYNIKTHFGNNLWDNVVTTNTHQKINGTTIMTASSVQANNLQTKTLNSLHINGYDFNALVNDTIVEGQEKQILGHKKFVALRAQNLVVQTLDMDDVPKLIEGARATFEINENINLPNNILIENIVFNKHFNGVPSENFGHPWMFSESEQTIESDQNFVKLVIHGKLFVESGFINDINVIDISENSIKNDEPFHFGTVTFAKGLASLQGISLEGKFESLYLNDIVQSNTQVKQIITGKTLFNNNVAIYGEVHFNGLVSGVNISNLCSFALSYDSHGPYNLHVKGNAYFAKGPVVQHINTLPIKYILENAWFQNQEVHLTGYLHFDEVIFNQEITVHGLIDNVRPQEIAETYFSKTKDQNITVRLDFDNKVVFTNGLYASEAIVEGMVCGLNLEEFIHTALLDGYDQVFENTIYLDVCEIQDLKGEYLVNNLNLENEVMRYDKPNIVTGKKVIQNLQVHSMNLDHNIKVQHVDLLWWLQTAVLKKGQFSFSGETVFNNETQFLSHISVQGFVNHQMFNQDTVMLTSGPQVITGNKKISGESNFQSVKLKGYLNGFNPSEFLYNQAYKNQNISFKTPIHFSAEIATPNVNIEKLYQGVNVSRLMHNLTRFATIENYQEHYEKLLTTSSRVRKSLIDQAYFVDHYEVKQIYKMVHSIIPVTFENSTDQYLAYIVEEGSNQNYSIMFHVWNKEKEQFHHVNDIEDIQVPLQLHYINKILFKGKECWYIENKSRDNTTNETSIEASIYEVTKEGLLRIVPIIIHNGTNSVSTLVLPDKNKSCIFLLFSQNSMLYCEQQADEDISLELFQIFNTSNGIEATSDKIQDSVYIFIVNKGTVFDDPTIDIWKYDATTGIFNIEQHIYTTNPNSLNVAFYRETSYLIIASGRLQNAKHAGLLNIYKYNNNTKEYEMYQNININAPVQVQFAELPTRELILYVVTENPTESLVIFTYEGIAGFQQKIVASTLSKTTAITSFNAPDNRHFVLAQNGNETRVIEGVFKGQYF